MVNFAMCFGSPGLASPLAADGQVPWSGDSCPEGYEFLRDRWHPGDRIFVFGTGSAAVGALGLVRLLDTVGIVSAQVPAPVLDYALAHWARPTRRRTPSEWRHLHALGCRLRGGQPPVPVSYLGLLDGLKTSAARAYSPFDGVGNISAGRHAVAIDEPRPHIEVHAPEVEQAWFRGTHADITTGTLATEWVLAGAVTAGLASHSPVAPPEAVPERRTPAMSALAGVRPSRLVPTARRRVPDGARVHRSVESHLARHDRYWRRLPHWFTWVDTEWPECDADPLRPEDVARAS